MKNSEKTIVMTTKNFIENQLEKFVDDGHLDTIHYLDIEVTEDNNNVILDDSQFAEIIKFSKKEKQDTVIRELNNLYCIPE